MGDQHFVRSLPILMALWMAWGSPAVGATGKTGPGAADPEATNRVLSNAALHAAWRWDETGPGEVTLTGSPRGPSLELAGGLLPKFDLGTDTKWNLAESDPAEIRQEKDRVTVRYPPHASGLEAEWEAVLPPEGNYLAVTVRVRSSAGAVPVNRVVFLDTTLLGAEGVGKVDGSVVRWGDFFLAAEHPLAHNRVLEGGRVVCALPRGNTLRPDTAWTFSFVAGVTRPGQFRRGFLAYLEQRRARPYQPFLHYNSWYHLNIARPDHRMTEAECLETIDHIGRELVEKRNVRLDAFVWDDGWDHFHSLWGFHDGFPHGFKLLRQRAEPFGAAMGVWMSPWGGYGGPKDKRVTFGTSQGYETNANGFSMAGPKYRAAFRDVCLDMMRNQGVAFFKFDGMGSGNGTGAAGELADDVDAVLQLCRELRAEDPDLFISATVGTWASPFWLLYADSIWRQGGDTGFHGTGNDREQWITYRDKWAHSHVAQAGPLYPFNSLMLHGPCIGDRANPGRMPLDEASIRHELRTFFGSGTALQELYISPHLFSPAMWDDLAAAATWARKRTDVLVDSHWVGGDPGRGEIYGWAAWRPGLGVITLRNPSDQPQTFSLDTARCLELDEGDRATRVLTSPYPDQRIRRLEAKAEAVASIDFEPFEVLVFEVRKEAP